MHVRNYVFTQISQNELRDFKVFFINSFADTARILICQVSVMNIFTLLLVVNQILALSLIDILPQLPRELSIPL